MKNKISAGALAVAMAIVMLFAFGCGDNGGTAGAPTVQKNCITMCIGEEEVIKNANGQPIDGQFLSTAPQTVSVDGTGRIRALQVGSGVIVIRTSGGSAVCTVIVTGEKPIDINKLQITGKPEKLTAGQVVSLEYVKEPLDADNYNSIKWITSDANVVSVSSDGIMQAVAPGAATVTLTATGTNFKDSFLVEVIARPSTLKLNVVDACGIVGSSDLMLIPDLFTDYKDVSAGVWSSDNSAVASVENGKVSFIGEGKTTIRYSVTAGGENLEAVCKVASVVKNGYTVIRTPEQLQDIANTSGNYMLGNDIDLEEACSKNGALYHGGAGFSPLFSDALNAFSGTFDGMGYTISNIMIQSSNPFTALISYISTVKGKEGRICNLAMEGGTISGGNYTAALVGRCSTTDGSSGSIIENCLINVNVVSFGYAAGIIGFNGGIIRNCISLCDISGSLTAAIALRQCDSDEIGVFFAMALEGGIDCLVPADKNFSAAMNAAFASEKALKSPASYYGWSREVWHIADGEYPHLLTPNDR